MLKYNKELMSLMASNMSSLARSIGGGASGARPRATRRKGGNLWTKIKEGFESVGKYVKDNKLLSKGLALLPGPLAKSASVATGAFGHGRRPRARKRGGNKVMNFLKKSHAYIKSQRLISNALRNNGYARVANVTHALGYGRKKRARRQGGNLKSFIKKAHAYVKDKRIISSALKHFGYDRLGKASHAAGYGRSRRPRRTRR